MNQHDLAKLAAALDEDEKACKTMHGAAPGTLAANPTFTEAARQAIAAGFNMKQIIVAFLGGLATGGFAGGVAAVLALLVSPPTP